MPILKIPISERFRGVIIIDSTYWHTEESFKTLFHVNFPKDVFYKMAVNDQLIRFRLFGTNYYRIGPTWSDGLRQESGITDIGDCVCFEVDDGSLKLTSLVPDGGLRIFGNRRGMLKIKGKWIESWSIIYRDRDLTWRTMANYLNFFGIKNPSTVYAGLKTGRIASMDFLGKKNILYTKMGGLND